jgi:aubergine-like protein
VWPGFASSIHMLEKGILLNIDIVHKVLRTESVLDLINEIKNKSRGDIKADIKKQLIGTTILTTYNKRTYKVDDVNFEMSPKDSFKQDEEKGEITF